MDRWVALGWSNASCTKQYRKKSMISIPRARNRRNVFGPIRLDSKTKTHISKPQQKLSYTNADGQYEGARH
jgi:hypothetical protein